MDPLRYNVNLTTTFLLPILYDKGLKHSDILTDTFINAYIADLNKPEHDDKIFIEYATITNLPSWTKDSHLYPTNEESIMVTQDIPTEIVDDYSLFLIGDYSKFSNEHKQRVLQFWEADSHTLLYGVLHRTGRAIKKFWEESLDADLDVAPLDIEYWKPPNLKQEIFGMTGDE